MTSRLLTVPDWTSAYRNGASPRELLTDLSRRLADSPPGVWIALVQPESLDRQLAALEARAAELGDMAAVLERMPLYGVPFAAKDNIDVGGFPTTAACPAFAFTPSAHANAVARLVDAGAVCMGKTNLDQFATGLVGTRSPYGQPASTFASDRVSGGSSSGSAVVVSRGDVAFALGTDTAGSGRVPAGFNNVVGLKPTPGRVGTSGVVPACRSLDCVSVFALTVADAAQVLRLIEGADPADPYSAFVVGPDRLPRTLRIGVPIQPVFGSDGDYPAAFEAAVAAVRSHGHTVQALDFSPLHRVAELLYEGPWVAERQVAVQALLEHDPAAIDPIVRTVIESAGRFSAADAFRAHYKLRAAQRDTAAIWNEVDLLMVPTAPGHPLHADIAADPIGANARLGVYTNFVNLLGWCALALPAGFTTEGLPFGVTFIGPTAHDTALARFGIDWQARLDLPLGCTDAKLATHSGPTPLRWPASEAALPIAVVGAHLSGLGLNSQLTERGATLRAATRTAPHYRLHALPGTHPPKPGMQRVAHGGVAIDVEVWDLPLAAVGSFVALIPPPLGLGQVELADGRYVHGFLCEAHALDGAPDISHHGGWRAYLASLAAAAAAPSPALSPQPLEPA